MNQQGNQAGPSSANPETQEGLKETQQTEKEIIDGANNDDQLEKLKKGTESDREENPGYSQENNNN